MTSTFRPMLLALAACALLAGGCGGDDEGGGATGGSELSGRIEADGSSTVGPFTTRAAERFQQENSGVQITVGISGTGGGFERFCAGETDLSDASRPIEDDEKQACEEKGIEYVEFQVANDALTVVVNEENDWATCLTTAQLKQIWEPGSKVDSWSDVDPKVPDEKLSLFGPGTDSGTFDYFTDAIVGEEGASRSDYSASETTTSSSRVSPARRAGSATSASRTTRRTRTSSTRSRSTAGTAASRRASGRRRTAPTSRSRGRSSSTRRRSRSSGPR